MNKNLPKSIDEIEFVPFVGRDIDLNTKGKPSVYLRDVIIPYYRKVIRGLETEIRDLRKSKKALLERKNEQISSKRWLKHKSNQKRYAVQQSKVNIKASELSKEKFKKEAFKQPIPMYSVLFYPIMLKASYKHSINIVDLIYIAYTWNFMFLSISDYKVFFGENFKMSILNRCKNNGYIDCQKTKINQYYLSVKGKNLINGLIDEFKELKNAEA